MWDEPSLPPVSPPPGTMTSATPIAQVWPPADTRAAAPRPNHSQAGLSRVNASWPTSMSATPNGRPTTAVAHWNTGSAPGTCAGNRTRSIRSCPIDPSTCVRNSTRSRPSHRIVSWVIRRSPSGNWAISRAPSAQRCAATSAGAPPDPDPGPFGHSSHGPSPQRGCAGYSSASTSSLPRPRSSPAPVRRLVIRPSPPPRAGSAATSNASLAITVPGMPVQPAPGAGPAPGPGSPPEPAAAVTQ